MTKKSIYALLFVCLFILGGCKTTSDWPYFSGFLSDYKGMYRSSDIEGIFMIKHDVKNVNDYSKFLVDPVAVRLTPEAQAYQTEQSEIERIARNFREDVIAALSESNTVVEAPGAGVIRLRLAITDILAVKKAGASVGIVEAEFVDTQYKERVAAVITSIKGMRLDEWASLLKDRLIYLSSDTKSFQVK